KHGLKGMSYLLRGIKPGPDSAWQFVRDQSTFMQHRLETFNKDIMNAEQQLITKESRKWRDMMTTSSFWLILKTQQLVDTAAWLGTYHQAMAGEAGPNINAGDHDMAVAYADRMVARSQGTGVVSDRTPVERGTLNRNVRNTEIVRIWSALGSYMFAKGNVAY